MNHKLTREGLETKNILHFNHNTTGSGTRGKVM